MNISPINGAISQTKNHVKTAASKAFEQAIFEGKADQFIGKAMALEGKAVNFPRVFANVIAAGTVGTKDFFVNLVKNLK